MLTSLVGVQHMLAHNDIPRFKALNSVTRLDNSTDPSAVTGNVFLHIRILLQLYDCAILIGKAKYY